MLINVDQKLDSPGGYLKYLKALKCIYWSLFTFTPLHVEPSKGKRFFVVIIKQIYLLQTNSLTQFRIKCCRFNRVQRCCDFLWCIYWCFSNNIKLLAAISGCFFWFLCPSVTMLSDIIGLAGMLRLKSEFFGSFLTCKLSMLHIEPSLGEVLCRVWSLNQL